MKILFVTGDDFAAVSVEEEIGIEAAAKMTEENGGELILNKQFYAELMIREFGEVDPFFISFIRDRIEDSDHKKTTDFFILEGGGFMND